jgi:methyltransferase-like protein 23
MQLQNSKIETHFNIQVLVPNIDNELLKLDSNPFWAKIWHSAIALAQFIEDNAQLFINKNIVEIGAGIGLPSFVASKLAKQVIATDISEAALQLITLISNQNHISNLTTANYNWHHPFEFNDIDIVLLSDINYEPNQFEAIYSLITSLQQKNIQIYLATPQRLMAKSFIERLFPLIKSNSEIKVAYANETKYISIFQL